MFRCMYLNIASLGCLHSWNTHIVKFQRYYIGIRIWWLTANSTNLILSDNIPDSFQYLCAKNILAIKVFQHRVVLCNIYCYSNLFYGTITIYRSQPTNPSRTMLRKPIVHYFNLESLSWCRVISIQDLLLYTALIIYGVVSIAPPLHIWIADHWLETAWFNEYVINYINIAFDIIKIKHRIYVAIATFYRAVNQDSLFHRIYPCVCMHVANSVYSIITWVGFVYYSGATELHSHWMFTQHALGKVYMHRDIASM